MMRKIVSRVPLERIVLLALCSATGALPGKEHLKIQHQMKQHVFFVKVVAISRPQGKQIVLIVMLEIISPKMAQHTVSHVMQDCINLKMDKQHAKNVLLGSSNRLAVQRDA